MPKRPAEPAVFPSDARGVRADGYVWPLSAAILLLVGSVAGIVLATQDFSDPRALWQRGWAHLATSGWVHMAADILLLGVLIISSSMFRGVTKRRVEFCVLLSLVAHLWMAVGLYAQPMPVVLGVENPEFEILEQPEQEPVSIPDYHWQRIDEGPADENIPKVIEEFDKPVETPLPGPSERAKVEPPPPEREAPKAKSLPKEAEPAAENKPQPAPLARAEIRSQQPNVTPEGPKASRQSLQTRLEPGQPIPEPEVRASEAAAASLEARAVELQRQSQQTSPPQMASLPNTVLPPSAPSPKIARSAADRDLPPGLPAGSALAKQTSRPAEIDAAPAETPEPVAAANQSNPGPPESRSADAERRRENPQRIGRGGSGAIDGADTPPSNRTALPSRQATIAPEIEVAATGPNGIPRRSTARTSPQLEMLPIQEPEVVNSSPGEGRGRPIPLEARADEIRRASTGPSRIAANARMGDAGQPSITGTAIGQATLTRRSIDEQSASPSDSIGGMAGGSGLLARSGTRPDLPSSATLAEDAGVPGSRGAGSPTGSAAGQIDAAPSTSLAGPNAGFGGPLLKIDAPIGPGSIGSGPPAAIGVRGSSMREGDIAPGTSLKTSSLAKSNVLPILSGGTGEDPREFFKQRSPDRRGSVGQAYGGSPKTEQAVERGIEFLVRHQFPDGHWSIDRFPQASAPGYEDAALGSMNADTAGTGLALLAMLGAGYTHQQGKHHDVVDRGLNWLVRNQQEDGRLTRPQTDRTRYALSYGHAIASIALCEAYGMTRDAKLRAPAERAIQYIINSQDPERGGWRYEARRESDTSVSGWKLMAMKSAQMSGIQVPSTTLQRVSHWLDQAQASGGSLYAYNPYASDTDAQREGRRASLAMTAEGLLMRMWLGWRRDNPALVQGTKTLVANLPDDGAFGQSYRDAYYWYYATQVMFQMQGDGWKAWNDRLLAILPPQQVTEGPLAGSWHPERPTLDRWGKAAGRHYVTCLNLLMLEVYYRHLPLYRPLEK